jgi:flavin-dependent dehydrogenase
VKGEGLNLDAIAAHPWDAIIIGGGPAGSTAAAILGQRGRSVLLLEKEKFPRYHVGESLMPFCYYTLDRLGVIEELKRQAYPRKYSVQFARRNGEVSQPFYFFEHLDHEAATTWQVTRSEFDEMLLNNARRKGARVLEETRARGFIERDGAVVGVRAETADGGTMEVRAPVTIDASGRDALGISRNRWRVRDPELNKVAIWTYYRGGKRDPGYDAGATTVAYLENKGWFWYIPLATDVVSVGVVAERDYLYRAGRDPAEIFRAEIPNNRWIADHLAGAEPFGPHYVTGEYSYRARYCASDGIVLAGDAFAFLDPVFSSGVFLALWSGEQAAHAVDAALRGGHCRGDAFTTYGSTMCRGMEAMRKLVYAFYDPEFSFGKLVRRHPEVRGRLTDCLIGDLFEKEYGELFAAIKSIASVPDELEHGCGSQPMPTVAAPPGEH